MAGTDCGAAGEWKNLYESIERHYDNEDGIFKSNHVQNGFYVVKNIPLSFQAQAYYIFILINIQKKISMLESCLGAAAWWCLVEEQTCEQEW